MDDIGLDFEEEWKLKECKLKEAFENCRSHCKRVEDDFSATWDTFQRQLRELKAREEAIGLREKQLEERESYFESMKEFKEEELDAIEEVITEKLIQVEQVKSELERVTLLVEEKTQELDSKEEWFLEVEKLVRETERECELIQNRIEERTVNLRRIEKLIGEMNVEVSNFRLQEKSVENWCHKVDLKMKELERVTEKLELKKELLNQTVGELHFLHYTVKYCLNEVQRKERELELKETQVESKVKELKLTEMRIHKCLNEVELKERHFDSLKKSLEEKKCLISLNKTAEEHKKHLDLLHKLVKKCEKDLDSLPDEIQRETRDLNRQVKGLEMKQTQFDCHLNTDCTQNKVAAFLRLTPDPAKLVLNYMQKFVAQYLRNGCFKERIMLLGTISILKELMIVSPHVGSHLKEDSTTLAAQWKEKMRGTTMSPDESIAFSLFIAMYGLVSMLTVNEIVTLLGLISQNQRALEFCHAHGFAVKIADFILILIQKKHMIEAVRFICTFKLIDKLPPIPLSKEYVEDATKSLEAVCRIRIALDGKVRLVDNLIGFLRTVHQCIKDYNLDESEFPSANIELQVAQLEELKVNWRRLATSVGSNEHKEQRKRKESDTLTYYRRVSTRRAI